MGERAVTLGPSNSRSPSGCRAAIHACPNACPVRLVRVNATLGDGNHARSGSRCPVSGGPPVCPYHCPGSGRKVTESNIDLRDDHRDGWSGHRLTGRPSGGFTGRFRRWTGPWQCRRARRAADARRRENRPDVGRVHRPVGHRRLCGAPGLHQPWHRVRCDPRASVEEVAAACCRPRSPGPAPGSRPPTSTKWPATRSSPHRSRPIPDDVVDPPRPPSRQAVAGACCDMYNNAYTLYGQLRRTAAHRGVLP